MTVRVRTEYSHLCNKCGATGSFFLEMDDTHERTNGNRNPEFIPNRGVRLENGIFYCMNCGAQFA